jgi:hypothetical protein
MKPSVPGSALARVVTVMSCFALFGASCRCGGSVDSIGTSFRVEPAQIDFGRVLVGQRATKSIQVIADSRSDVTVTLSTEQPFDTAASATVPGASERGIDITFDATLGQFEKTLTLQSGDIVKTVTLRGEGLNALGCVPSAPCRVSTYSLESNSCVESIAPEDSACEPTSLCLERGRCKAGQCLGVARNCDDNNQCTIDGCAADVGCVYAPVRCPLPSKPCEVATCSPSRGCGTASAPDFALCGAVDCNKANVCIAGQCANIDTPEGFPCGQAIACLPEPTCQAKKCTRPDAGPWLPDWVQAVPGTQDKVDTALVENNGALYFSVCGVSPPSASAGQDSDAGRDGDAGFDSDGGLDAGPFCALVSYTSTGFERFVTPLAADENARVLSADLTRVTVASDAQVSVFSPTKGQRLEALNPPPLSGSSLATSADFTLSWLAAEDGGTALYSVTDGGTFKVATLPGSFSALAIDPNGSRWASANDGRLWALRSDGGIFETRADAGASEFSVAQNLLALGSSHLLTLSGDTVTEQRFAPTAGRYEPLTRETLLSAESAVVFFEQCPNPLTSCVSSVRELWVRAVDSKTGAVKWDAPVGSPSTNTVLRDAVMVAVPGAGVAAVTSSEQLGIVKTELTAIVDGTRLGACAVDAPGIVKSVRLTPTQLVVSAESDAGVKLYAYPLGAFPYRFDGWPTFAGQSGQRRAE